MWCANSDKDICFVECCCKCSFYFLMIGMLCNPCFEGVHVFFSSLVNRPFFVADNNFCDCARIDECCEQDNSCAVLVIMHYGNGKSLKLFFDQKTIGCCNVFQANC